MHDKNIIYRDLKPENVVLDAKSGYAKLIDFGFAKRLEQSIFTSRTKSICFTLDYLSPEMILRQPYNHSVDIWAVGILIYELIAGYPPFYNMGSSQGDHQRVYEAILHAQIQYPSHFSQEVKELISSMLVKNPLSRLGCTTTNGIYDVMAHRWFNPPFNCNEQQQSTSNDNNVFSWQLLRQLELKPPFQPSSKVVLKKPPKDLNHYCLDEKNQPHINKLLQLDNEYHFNSQFGCLLEERDYPDIWSDF
jgi:serine/threonine protein kinase